MTGQFYGHTHNDEFTMFYDYDTNKIPINIIDSSNICQIETENCGICLENISLDTNGNIFQITDCKHLFHDFENETIC